MKKFITPTYTFTPGASGVGTVNLSGISGFNVRNLVAIINQTDGIVIYSTGSTSLRYTNVASTTITLFYDTSAMDAGDTLQVIYEDNSDALMGAVDETAPVSDTASSGLNGRLQRIAQRITSLIALFPSSIGQKNTAGSLSVTLSSDHANVAISPAYISGTLKAAQITVGLTEVRATHDNAAPSATRKKLIIKPSASNTGKIFLIPTGGSTSTGLEIIGPDRLVFEYDPTEYYLISDTAAQVVEIMEIE